MAGKVKIEINQSTRDAMNETGKKGDTYDSLICDMLDMYNQLMVHRAERRIDPDNGEE